MGSAQTPIDHDAEINALQALLETPAHLRRFPAALDADFHAHMLEQGLQLTRDSLWALLLVGPAVFVVLRALMGLVSSPEYAVGNLVVFDSCMTVLLLTVLLIAITPWLPAVRKLFPVYMLSTSGATVASVAIATSAYPEPYLNVLSAFVTSIIILLIYALNVVNVRLATLAGIGGVLVAYVVVRMQGLWYDPGYFIAYAVLPNAIGVLVGELITVRDRVSYLQSRLLSAEKIRVDRYAAEVERLSCEDALTSLANRRHFNDSLEREWNLARRQRHAIALLFVDVDYFKPFNDTYGHQAGDLVLTAIGAALAGAVKRPADLAARYGGEEFVILLPDTTQEGAQEMATQVAANLRALAIPHGASKVADHVTVSIGVAAIIPGEHNNSAQLLAAADAAVYDAKEAGRNQIKIAEGLS